MRRRRNGLRRKVLSVVQRTTRHWSSRTGFDDKESEQDEVTTLTIEIPYSVDEICEALEEFRREKVLKIKHQGPLHDLVMSLADMDRIYYTEKRKRESAANA